LDQKLVHSIEGRREEILLLVEFINVMVLLCGRTQSANCGDRIYFLNLNKEVFYGA
jgi:hypothetical protein